MARQGAAWRLARWLARNAASPLPNPSKLIRGSISTSSTGATPTLLVVRGSAMSQRVVLVIGLAVAIASPAHAKPPGECLALEESLGTDRDVGFTGVSLDRFGFASFFAYGVLQRSVSQQIVPPPGFVQTWTTRHPVEHLFADRSFFIEPELSEKIQPFNVNQADRINLEISFTGSTVAVAGGPPPGTPWVTISLRSGNDTKVSFTPVCDAQHHMITGADSGGSKYLLYIRSKPWPLLVLSQHD
jgi:hypothetical protein